MGNHVLLIGLVLSHKASNDGIHLIRDHYLTAVRDEIPPARVRMVFVSLRERDCFVSNHGLCDLDILARVFQCQCHGNRNNISIGMLIVP